MLAWFIIKALGKLVICVFAALGAFQALPPKAQKQGEAILRRAHNLQPCLRWAAFALIIGFIVLYFIAEMKTDWYQWKQMHNAPLKTEALNLASQLQDFADKYERTDYNRRYTDISYVYFPEITEMRKRLRRAGLVSERLDEMLATTPTSLGVTSNWLNAASVELRSLANALKSF